MFLKLDMFTMVKFDQIKSIVCGTYKEKEEKDLFLVQVFLIQEGMVETILGKEELKSISDQIDRYNDWKAGNVSNFKEKEKKDSTQEFNKNNPFKVD